MFAAVLPDFINLDNINRDNLAFGLADEGGEAFPILRRQAGALAGGRVDERSGPLQSAFGRSIEQFVNLLAVIRNQENANLNIALRGNADIIFAEFADADGIAPRLGDGHQFLLIVIRGHRIGRLRVRRR